MQQRSRCCSPVTCGVKCCFLQLRLGSQSWARQSRTRFYRLLPTRWFIWTSRRIYDRTRHSSSNTRAPSGEKKKWRVGWQKAKSGVPLVDPLLQRVPNWPGITSNVRRATWHMASASRCATRCFSRSSQLFSPVLMPRPLEKYPVCELDAQFFRQRC